jgi:hypothetical protein
LSPFSELIGAGLNGFWNDSSFGVDSNTTSSCIKDFTACSLLHGNRIRKLQGVSPLTLFSVLFSLPFKVVSFSQGIVRNPDLEFKKDAVNDFLQNLRQN